MAQQERARRTRERVLDAAAVEFSAHGYTRATLHSVAERIGMTKGALYGHFAGKDELAGALGQHAWDVWDLATLRASDEAGGAPCRELALLLADLFRLVHCEPRSRAGFSLTVDRADADGPGGGDLLLDVRDHVAALVGKAQQAGEFRSELDVDTVVDLLLAVVFSAPSLRRSVADADAGADADADEARWFDEVWPVLEDALLVAGVS